MSVTRTQKLWFWCLVGYLAADVGVVLFSLMQSWIAAVGCIVFAAVMWMCMKELSRWIIQDEMPPLGKQ